MSAEDRRQTTDDRPQPAVSRGLSSVVFPNMARHIYDRYAPGDRVEIRFGDAAEAEWVTAVVLRAEPPGLWVRTADGREWFVTNTYRIRPAEEGSSADWTDLAD